MIKLPNDKVLRNLPEQVGANARHIQEIGGDLDGQLPTHLYLHQITFHPSGNVYWVLKFITNRSSKYTNYFSLFEDFERAKILFMNFENNPVYDLAIATSPSIYICSIGFVGGTGLVPYTNEVAFSQITNYTVEAY